MPRWTNLLVFLFAAAHAFCAQGREDEAARYSQEATAAMQAKNWPAAAKALRKLEQIAPEVAEVHANLGLVYYSQNKVAEAAAELERALRINPEIPNAPVLLGLCKAELGQEDDAIRLLAPQYPRTADRELRRMVGVRLMRAYSGAGQFARAAETGEGLLGDYPNDAEVLYQVAQLHADRSYQIMKQLQQSAPHSAWVHFASAQVQDSLKHYDAAEAEYRKALETEARSARRALPARTGAARPVAITREPQRGRRAVPVGTRHLAGERGCRIRTRRDRARARGSRRRAGTSQPGREVSPRLCGSADRDRANPAQTGQGARGSGKSASRIACHSG